MESAVLLSAVMLFIAPVNAFDLKDIKVSEIKNSEIALHAPVPEAGGTARCGHANGEITELHLIPNTIQSKLVSSVDTPELFREFTDFWTPILAKSGIEITGSEYLDTVGVLNYRSPGGLVVRDFMAGNLHYNAMDPAAIKQLQHELLEPLEKAGMTPVASFTIKNDAFRPTFNIYYLTKPEMNPARETRLRQLIGDMDIDYDILETAGINIVKKDAGFSVAYIGKEIMFASKAADTEDAINKKVAAYLKFLEEDGHELIAYRIHKLTEPFTIGGLTYNYAANLYAYR